MRQVQQHSVCSQCCCVTTVELLSSSSWVAVAASAALQKQHYLLQTATTSIPRSRWKAWSSVKFISLESWLLLHTLTNIHFGSKNSIWKMFVIVTFGTFLVTVLVTFWNIFEFESVLCQFWVTYESLLSQFWVTFQSGLSQFWVTFESIWFSSHIWVTFKSHLSQFWVSFEVLLSHILKSF